MMELANSICKIVSDYREGEIPPRTPEDVIRWVGQFERGVRKPLLHELDHVLRSTYLSRRRVVKFLRALIRNDALVGPDPEKFWESALLLDVQQGGSSQRDMLVLFRALLEEEFPTLRARRPRDLQVFVYLDDVIFTGRRVRTDLEAWARALAPADCALHVIAIGTHQGSYYHQGELTKTMNGTGKRIKTTWWHAFEAENRKAYMGQSDVLRPRAIPDDEDVRRYFGAFSHPVILRTGNGQGECEFFSGEEGRHLMEQVFLRAGVQVRKQCMNLPVPHRPLGFEGLETPGFGSMIVTFRNCPNNAPLAIWVDAPWFPLFPRKVN